MTDTAALLSKKRDLEQELNLVNAKLDEARQQQRAQGLASVLAIMKDFDLTVEDLGLSGRVQGRAKASARAGKTVPIKFRSSSGDTWSGRGLQPRWLKAALASGKALADFAV